MKKETAILLFKIAWVYFLLINIAEFTIHNKPDFIPFINFSGIPYLKYLPFFILTIIIIPFRVFKRIFDNTFIKNVFILLLILSLFSFITGIFSSYPGVARYNSSRMTFFILIMFLVLAVYYTYPRTSEFLLKSFLFSSLLVLAGSLLDYYSPEFHNLLKSNFGRPDAMNSFMKIGNEIFIRPMGFITDANLAAFYIAFAMLLFLVNNEFLKNKFLKAGFYLVSSYVFGLLASRGALLIVIFTVTMFFIFKLVSRKELILFVVIFIVSQLITPQTQARISQIFNPQTIEEEFEVGRPVIWKASIELFKTNPVFGVGLGNFFEVSDIYIRKILEKKPELNINNPELPGYHKIDKYNPHNIFLVMATETGILGLLIFCTLLIVLFLYYKKSKFYISLIFLTDILIVSFLSNYAPYYKIYLIICIVFFVLSLNNMKTINRNEV